MIISLYRILRWIVFLFLSSFDRRAILFKYCLICTGIILLRRVLDICVHVYVYRSSHRVCSLKKLFLEISQCSQDLTGKHLYERLLLMSRSIRLYHVIYFSLSFSFFYYSYSRRLIRIGKTDFWKFMFKVQVQGVPYFLLYSLPISAYEKC